MSEDNEVRISSAVHRWELWLLGALFTAVVFYAIQDRNRLVELQDATQHRLLIDEERITRIEEQHANIVAGQTQLRDGQVEIRNRQKDQIDKLDHLIELLDNTAFYYRKPK